MAKIIKNYPENKEQIVASGNQKALVELRNAVFHLNKVIVKVQNKDYFLDVIRESRKVRQFMRRADKQIRIYHLEKCIMGDLQSQGKNKQLKEVCSFIKGDKSL